MRDKSPQELTAATKETELLVNALQGATASHGYWLNAAGRTAPRFYGSGPSVSAFNGLIMALHSDQHGYRTAHYIPFTEAKKQGDAILQHEHGIPFHWYKWEKYVNRHDPGDTLSRNDYLLLPPDKRILYKGIRNREIRTLFNIDQTTLPMSDPDKYRYLTERHGGINDRGNLKAEERMLRSAVNRFAVQMKDNLVPIRKDSAGLPHYDTAKDAVYVPEQKHFEHYEDYVRELVRQVTGATGHQQRMAREGMVMQGGKAPSEDAVKYERLVNELASGIKLMDFGLPAKLSEDSLPLVEYWTRELQENPRLIDAIEGDVNNAVDVMRKAEEGEKVEYATLRNRQQTAEWREGKPQVNTSETLVLQDILRHGGLSIDERNFPSAYERAAFLEKFSMGYYDRQKEMSFPQVHDDDPEIAELAYTQVLKYGAEIDRACREYLPADWERKGSYAVSDELKNFVSRENRTMAVIHDKKSGITDVVLPGGAMCGGHVTVNGGDKRPYFLTPDEVMGAEEREAVQAKVTVFNIPHFSKQRIEAALMQKGSRYVRFFNPDGLLGYHPDDGYFEGKRLSLATLFGKELKETGTLDVSKTVDRATNVQFDRVQMVKDDNSRWALYLKPAGEKPFAVYPNKEDTNRFFTSVKQNNHEVSQAVRMELAQKYYALANNQPNLKLDLFGQKPEDVDLSKIQRVNVFRGKDERYLCFPVIEGADKLQPREITPLQWQRLWIAEDTAEYKRNLAATLFADVLRQQSQGQTENVPKEEAKKGKETGEIRIPEKDTPAVRPPEEKKTPAVTQAMLKQFEQLKGKHPDAILLFRVKDNYETYKQDAQTVGKILGIKVSALRHPAQDSHIETASFPKNELDSSLSKLIRAGQRIAICDLPEEPRQAENNGLSKSGQENEEVRAGRRM